MVVVFAKTSSSTVMEDFTSRTPDLGCFARPSRIFAFSLSSIDIFLTTLKTFFSAGSKVAFGFSGGGGSGFLLWIISWVGHSASLTTCSSSVRLSSSASCFPMLEYHKLSSSSRSSFTQAFTTTRSLRSVKIWIGCGFLEGRFCFCSVVYEFLLAAFLIVPQHEHNPH